MDIFKVYIIQCNDGSLYTGYAKCFSKRLKEHTEGGKKGSKYVRAKGFSKLLYISFFATKSEATKEEWRIKELPRRKKLQLIESASFHSGSSL